MEQIKYTKRICDDREKINGFLAQQRVGTLGMGEPGGRPYALPVNYVYMDNKVYIHGMGSGKKNDVLAANPSVCFTVFAEFGTVADPVPAKCDTAYFSVVIFGRAVKVEDVSEKTLALREIVEKFMPQYFKTPLAAQFIEQYRSSFDDRAVAVYRIDPEDITAKENSVNEANMFRG